MWSVPKMEKPICSLIINFLSQKNLRITVCIIIYVYSFEATDVEAMIIFGQTAEEAQVWVFLTSNVKKNYALI